MAANPEVKEEKLPTKQKKLPEPVRKLPQRSSETETSETDESGAVDYAAEWEAFKTAIEAGDNATIEGFIAEDATPDATADNVMGFATPEVQAAMKEYPYEKLGDVEFMERQAKEFTYQESSVDEEGNTWESAIFFYFQEQEEGLKLIGILAAG